MTPEPDTDYNLVLNPKLFKEKTDIFAT